MAAHATPRTRSSAEAVDADVRTARLRFDVKQRLTG
jgi:hypothetical protein